MIICIVAMEYLPCVWSNPACCSRTPISRCEANSAGVCSCIRLAARADFSLSATRLAQDGHAHVQRELEFTVGYTNSTSGRGAATTKPCAKTKPNAHTQTRCCG